MILRSLIRALDRRRREAAVAAGAAFLLGLLLVPGGPIGATVRARILLSPDSPWTPERARDALLSDEVLTPAGLGEPAGVRPLLKTSLDIGAVVVESSAATASGAAQRINAALRSLVEKAPEMARADIDAELGRLRATTAERAAELAALPPPSRGPDAPAAEQALKDLDREIERLSAAVEKGDAGPPHAVSTATSDKIAAALEEARRHLAGLQATYPADWPPVVRAAADVEDVRLRLQQARNREALEARFAPVREAIDRLRVLAGERETLVRNLDSLRARGAGPAPDVEARRASLQAHLRALDDRRVRLLAGRAAADVVIARLEPAGGASRSRSHLLLLLVLALALGAATAAVVERLTPALRTEHDVRRYVNLPLLGLIPKAAAEDDRLVLHADPRSRLIEPFNTMAALLEGRCAEAGAKVVAVTSARPGEGKSTVAANLAISLARGLARVLLVDADLRRPSQHQLLSLGEVPGLSSYLTGAADQLDAVMSTTEMENLTVLSAGPALQNPIPFLRSERLRVVLPELRERFDFVIVDLPPVRAAADALVMAPTMDGIVLVLAAGETGKDDATSAKRLIRDARGKLIGCVLNKTEIYSRSYYDYQPTPVAEPR